MLKESIAPLVKVQRECEFSLRFLLGKEKDQWRNFFTMLELVKKTTRNEILNDYGDCVLGERLLTVQEGLDMISSLSPKKGEKGRLSIRGYDEFIVDGRNVLDFAPSKHRYGILRKDWPFRFLQFRIQQDKAGQHWSRELLREGLPYYPDLSQAIIHFFDLPVDHFSSYGEFYAIITDYRAQIESLRLLYSKAEVKLRCPEIKYENLILKIFASSGSKMVTMPEIHPTSESVEFNIGFPPDILSVVLLSRDDSKKIDEKEFSTWRGEEEGILIERPQEEILSLTRAGESRNLEYKYDVDVQEQKNDFIESVIAFLNTNRGIILIGVRDDGEIVGSQKSKEDIRKIIHDTCDPPPVEVKIEEKEIAGKNIIVVEVPEGKDKPYQSKRDKNFYVRHGSNDMKMERSEILRILREKVSEERHMRF